MTEHESIIVDGIDTHLGNPLHRYQVFETNLLDVTGYESTGQVSKLVKYRQLYTGQFPEGQIWYRRENDFLGKTIINGQEIPNFTFVEMAQNALTE